MEKVKIDSENITQTSISINIYWLIEMHKQLILET